MAGECFCKAAELQLLLGSKHEGATHYVDGRYCYRKGEAVRCLQKAIEIYTDMGRFSIAAEHHITVAESELVDKEKAVQNKATTESVLIIFMCLIFKIFKALGTL